MEDLIIKEAIEYIKELFEGNSDGHDADHTLRVYKNAMAIAKGEENCDLYTIALAALLHDVDDYKNFSTENFANARKFLKEHGVSQDKEDEICSIIDSVSFSKNRGNSPRTLEGKIVQDADRLDAIGAIGIARTFAFGGKHERSLDSSIEHFHEKLLLLKDMMNTKTATEIALKRHDFMLIFLKEYKEESI